VLGQGQEEVCWTPTDPRFIIAPHVFPYRIQVSFKKVREVIINPIGHRGCGRGRDSGRDVDSVAAIAVQYVMETVCTTVGTTVPVRGVPEAT
jgi:hypothetical protein